MINLAQRKEFYHGPLLPGTLAETTFYVKRFGQEIVCDVEVVEFRGASAACADSYLCHFIKPAGLEDRVINSSDLYPFRYVED